MRPNKNLILGSLKKRISSALIRPDIMRDRIPHNENKTSKNKETVHVHEYRLDNEAHKERLKEQEKISEQLVDQVLLNDAYRTVEGVAALENEIFAETQKVLNQNAAEILESGCLCVHKRDTISRERKAMSFEERKEKYLGQEYPEYLQDKAQIEEEDIKDKEALDGQEKRKSRRTDRKKAKREKMVQEDYNGSAPEHEEKRFYDGQNFMLGLVAIVFSVDVGFVKSGLENIKDQFLTGSSLWTISILVSLLLALASHMAGEALREGKGRWRVGLPFAVIGILFLTITYLRMGSESAIIMMGVLLCGVCMIIYITYLRKNAAYFRLHEGIENDERELDNIKDQKNLKEEKKNNDLKVLLDQLHRDAAAKAENEETALKKELLVWDGSVVTYRTYLQNTLIETSDNIYKTAIRRLRSKANQARIEKGLDPHEFPPIKPLESQKFLDQLPPLEEDPPTHGEETPLDNPPLPTLPKSHQNGHAKVATLSALAALFLLASCSDFEAYKNYNPISHEAVIFFDANALDSVQTAESYTNFILDQIGFNTDSRAVNYDEYLISVSGIVEISSGRTKQVYLKQGKSPFDMVLQERLREQKTFVRDLKSLVEAQLQAPGLKTSYVAQNLCAGLSKLEQSSAQDRCLIAFSDLLHHEKSGLSFYRAKRRLTSDYKSISAKLDQRCDLVQEIANITDIKLLSVYLPPDSETDALYQEAKRTWKKYFSGKGIKHLKFMGNIPRSSLATH